MSQTRHPLGTVQEAVARFAAEADGGMFTMTAAITAVNIALNGSYDIWDRTTEGQARRVLDGMAMAGRLTKVGLHQAGPGGSVHSGRQPLFYTPEAYAAAEAAHEEQERARRADGDRWAGIHGTLTSLGIHPVTEPGQEIRLSAASWHKLLAMTAGRAPVPEAARSIMQ